MQTPIVAEYRLLLKYKKELLHVNIRGSIILTTPVLPYDTTVLESTQQLKS